MFSPTPRLIRAADIADADLDPAPLDPAQVVSGEPEVRHLAIVDDGSPVAIGIWQHGPGVSTDVEADEVFVVLAGQASIAFQGGPTLDIRAGDLVMLPAGAATTWTVNETLRKVYVVLA